MGKLALLVVPLCPTPLPFTCPCLYSLLLPDFLGLGVQDCHLLTKGTAHEEKSPGILGCNNGLILLLQEQKYSNP